MSAEAVTKSNAAKARQREFQETSNELQRQYEIARRSNNWREMDRIKDNLKFWCLTYQG